MRRKDREMSREFGLEVIDRAAYGVLSVVDSDGAPYALPLSIVRDGRICIFIRHVPDTKSNYSPMSLRPPLYL